MRRLQAIALCAAVCALCACEPLRSVNALPAASDNPSLSPVVNMTTDVTTPAKTADEPITTANPVTSGPALIVTPAPEPAATQPLPVEFDELVPAGLKARWAGSQAIVVRARNDASDEAEMWLYERTNGIWKPVAGPWPTMLGLNGTTKRIEGDNKSPSGAFLLGTAFGRAAKPTGMSYQYRKLDSRDRWVDGSSSPFYNRWVRGAKAVCGGGEDLSEVEQYKYALAVHYNDEAMQGAGSAIFIHVWRGPGQGTHGCTAISEANMVKLLRWLDYAKRPVLVQGTEEEIDQLMGGDWGMLCLPEGWGFADDFVQDAQLEIRYNTDNNFTGRRLSGYSASLAPMRMEAINALVSVAKELRAKSLGIRIYDAYRPQQATDAMIAWAEDETDTATKKEYYPDIDKVTIPGHFVARRSAHRTGGTVDLTIMNWKNGKNLDMGGPFDFFGDLSSFGYSGLTAGQAANRALLRNVMMKYGFKPYDVEWWHFSYPVGGGGGEFLILPREHVLQ